jgi:hypothetical protein
LLSIIEKRSFSIIERNGVEEAEGREGFLLTIAQQLDRVRGPLL